jgi:pseudomonalisin
MFLFSLGRFDKRSCASAARGYASAARGRATLGQMKPGRVLRTIAVVLTLTLSASCQAVLTTAAMPDGALPAVALPTTAQANRIVPSASLAPHLMLTGHVPAWATPQRQMGDPVDLSEPVHLTLLLQRAPQVQAAFDQMLTDQQNPASPLYHHWLTPAQIGTLYGPMQTDTDAIVAWATAQGFTLFTLQPNRVLLEFDATLATAAAAFRTSFARFTVSNREGSASRLSIVSEPMIPQAFAAVIGSIDGLVEAHFEPQSHVAFQAIATSHAIVTSQAIATSFTAAHPLATFNSSTSHLLAPGDFNIIYDLAGVQSAGNTGATIGTTTQHIAIIGRSRVTGADITAFESLTGLPNKQPNVVLAGSDLGIDPGIGADADEQTLDVERVIGTAPGAQVDLVIAANVGNSDGVNTALAYNVNILRDPVMSVSYGSCESDNGAGSTLGLSALFQAAAAEGITTLVSSGDSGAAGCDTPFTSAPANQFASINAMCASAYVTCVGGTEFNDDASPSSYWASGNGSGDSSALAYIPEGAWNEPGSSGSGYVVAASGGGASVFISKPAWQIGAGVPADGHRDVPDVAFSAAEHDGYLGCYTSNGGTASCVATAQGFPIAIFSGTSAAAPGMAGIVALLNTRAGSAQGNINPLLYSLAALTPAVFHDATPSSSGVGSACNTTTPSMCNNSTPASYSLNGGLVGYNLTPGYDQATGLGSIDVAKLLASVAGASTTTTALTLAAPVPNPAMIGEDVSLKATVTSGSFTATPTGTVQFYATLGGGSGSGTGSGVPSPLGSAVTLESGAATLSYAFSAAGAYTITAVYSGDLHFAASTAPGVTLNVSPASFTLTPATGTYNLVSGAVSGNSDVLTIDSTNNFDGSVNLACAVTSMSGSAAGTCSVGPGAVSVAANGTAQATLTIATTPGTSGALRLVVNGVSGSTSIASTPITVNLTAASFIIAASSSTATVSSGASAVSTVMLTSVNGFAGNVALACTASLLNGSAITTTSCSTTPSSIALTSGGTANATVAIATTAGTAGPLTATISATGTTSGASLTSTASTQVVVQVVSPATPGLSLTTSTTTLSFPSGATTNNSATLTLASVHAFAGVAALNCVVSTGTAGNPPSCAVSPNVVTLAANGTANATLSISSTAAHAAARGRPSPLERTALPVFAFLFCVPAISCRRRRNRSECRRSVHRRILGQALALTLLLGAALASTGCGADSYLAVAAPLRSSAGTYTVTVTASGVPSGGAAAITTSTTLSLTID